MSTLTLLLLIVLLVWFWQSSLHSRDTAGQAARETCKRQGLQFLDGTPSLQSVRPFFSGRGPGRKRTYTFDYSADGLARRTGCIIMYNTQVSAVLLDD
jgi:hypothetical protein